MNNRLLHCIGSLGGGGAERQLAYLAPELARHGWEVHVAFMRAGPNLARLTNAGVTLHHLERGGFRDPRLVWDLHRLLHRIKPSLVQTWLLQMDCIVGLLARVERIPWILSERSSAIAYSNSTQCRIRELLGVRATAVVCNSVGGHHYWSTQAGAPGRISVIPNGLPMSEIYATPAASLAEFGLSGNDPLAVYVGRMSPEKNVDKLLLAYCMVQPDLRLVLCGEGPARAGLERQIRQHGLTDRVTMLGYVSSVWSLLKSAQLFISLSSFEGHPNAVMEAMACGCPIVASDIPAQWDILGEETALLIDPESPANVAAAIEHVLKSPADAARRATLAREKSQQWSVAAAARRYHELYSEIIGNGRRRAA